ncbi:MAG: tetratricopeptide repeat protein [Acidobacteriota bacterium]
MKHKQIVYAVIGVIVGFIVGFFVSEALQRNQAEPPQMVASAPSAEQTGAASSELPEGHPPPEVLEKIGELSRQAEADPEDKQVRILLGNWYYDIGRFDGAIQWYEEALRLDPEDVNVRTDLGTSYLYTGKAETAIEMYQKSLAVEPDHPQTLQNLGFAYFAVEDFNSAIRTWQMLLDRHPEYPHAEQIKEQMNNARSRLQETRS